MSENLAWIDPLSSILLKNIDNYVDKSVDNNSNNHESQSSIETKYQTETTIKMVNKTKC